MKAISQFVVRVFDLIEAEGRDLRSVLRVEADRVHATLSHLAVGIAILLISVPLILAGLYLLAAGMLWWLETVVSRPVAAALAGLALLVAGISCFVLSKLLFLRRQS